MATVLVCNTIFDGEQVLADHALLIEGERISAVLPQAAAPADLPVIDYGNGLLVPGLIDLQVNGGGGVLFNLAPQVATLRTMATAHRAYGTTGFLPTLISDSPEVMRQGIAAVAQAIDESVPGVLGIHLEGPLLNPGRKGAHDAQRFQHADAQMLELMTSLEVGQTLVTLAPEVAGNAAISQLCDAGVIVSAGHSQASYEEARSALMAGVQGFTHLFNAMPPLLSRAPGLTGAAIEDEDSWFGIIADGHHVHPATLKIAVRAKARGKALLVTDAMPTVGSSADFFTLGGQRISVSGGRLTTPDGTLAGAHLDMLTAVNNTEKFAGIDWFEALRMASAYPAQALGMDAELGAIRSGMRASLLVLDAQRRPVDTWVDGRRYEPTSD